MTLRQTDIRRDTPADDAAMVRLGRAIVFILAPSAAAGAMLLGLAVALARLTG